MLIFPTPGEINQNCFGLQYPKCNPFPRKMFFLGEVCAIIIKLSAIVQEMFTLLFPWIARIESNVSYYAQEG
jgi:hypothetical protein